MPAARRVVIDISHEARTKPATQVTTAVILAGGPRSVRSALAHYYEPLNFPFANRPLLEWMLDWLLPQGVTNAIVVLSRGANEPDYDIRGASARTGVNVRLCVDREISGTAGCLRAVCDALGDAPFLVLSPGYLPPDLRVQELVEHHERCNAALTMVVEPRAPGQRRGEQIEMDENWRIRAVRVPYAPDPGGSSWTSAGVYLLSPRALAALSERGHVDLKEQFVSRLVEAGEGVFALPWRTPTLRPQSRSACLAVHHSSMARLELAPGGTRRRPDAAGSSAAPGAQISGEVVLGEGCEIEPGARVVGPVVMGDHCRVEAGAEVIGPTSLGDRCVVRARATVRHSVLWSEVEVGAGSAVSGCVVTKGSNIPEHTPVTDTTVIDERECPGASRMLPLLADDDGAALVCAGGRLVSTGSPRGRGRAYEVAKRTLDIAACAPALVVLSPLLVMIALAIKLDSRGPLLFVRKRCGLGGEPFPMLKFRTMRANAPALAPSVAALKQVDGPMFKMRNDPRVTRVGRVLRKTSLDELPQLANVLLGHMTLVGPRPLVMEEMACAPAWRDLRLRVRPGITGLWQVSGRSDSGFRSWIEHDMAYVKNRSLRLDLAILAKTVRVVTRCSGAH